MDIGSWIAIGLVGLALLIAFMYWQIETIQRLRNIKNGGKDK